MSTTAPEFYDSAMTAEDAPSMLPLEDSPWRALYVEAAGWVPANHEVTDLGCGTGRFVHALLHGNHYGPIVGVDFSAAALAEAALYLEDVGCDAETFELAEADLRSWEPAADRAGHATYVCLEVLEHLDDDVDLIRRVPPGHQLVLSVPNYESEAHLRVFRGAGDVFSRYDGLLSFRRWSLIDLGGGKAIHLADTVRRTDSW